MSILENISSLLTPSERKTALLLLALMFIGMLFETIGIGLVIPATALMMQYDLVIQYPAAKKLFVFLGHPTQVQMVTGAMLLLVGIYFIKNLFLAFLAWRQTCFTYNVQTGLSQRLFTVYLRQPYTFHLQRNSAQLMRNVTNEVSLFAGALTSGLMIVAEGLVLSGIAALLLFAEPLGATAVLLVLGGASWLFHRCTRTRITQWGETRQHHDGMRIQQLQQGLGGAKDVKLLGRESDFLNRYSTHNQASARASTLQTTVQLVPRLWLELLAVVGLAILVISMLQQGRELAIIVPTLGLFTAAAFRLMPSVNRILGSVQSLRYGLPVINTLHEELKLARPEPPSHLSSKNPLQQSICLKNITYSYPNSSKPALSEASFLIQKGESVGLIGPSGSGKSTLVDITLGLLTPASGTVSVDGKNIEANLRAWQDQIGYVSQTIYLTDDTLRRNVAFGLPNEQIDDAAIQSAIKDAQLEDFVAALPEGLDTLVGERGIRLSGGQRQRIGIARALYHNPSVLVLDEATSALDVVTEQGVIQAIKALRGSKTTLIVAHRLSTIDHCDRLYRLENGRITAEGSPADVLIPLK